MKRSKEFEKYCLGVSDVASLTLLGCGDDGVESKVLHFGGDGAYYAYICPKDVEIGTHYEKAASFRSWLKVYDDYGLRFFRHGNFSVYPVGDFECIIAEED